MKYSVQKHPILANDHDLAHFPGLVQQLLISRGITTKKQAEVFLCPDYDQHTYDPFLMKDMDKAVDRILQAIDAKEKIVIYSDYDADGIPGGALLASFFKKVGYTNIENYIPHRHHEGFGMHLEAVEKLVGNGAQLVVSVDCGIADHDAVNRINELGAEVIITDHHLAPQTEDGKDHLPKACAVINPKRRDCEYPFPMLCGSGVAYKLVQGILRKRDFGMKKGIEKWLLDLVGIATLSDMVPLLDENRVFAYYGLYVLKRSPRIGLRKLLKKIKVNQRHLTEDDISFMVTPRINAASRMDAPHKALELLLTEDEVEAGMLVDFLHGLNEERKGVVASTVKEIKRRLAKEDKQHKVLVMGSTKWKPSLLGLVAGSLTEEFNIPVFLWGKNGDETLKGSCRSPESVSVVDLMNESKDVLLQFGGHNQAGGFSVSRDKIHLLEEALTNAFMKISTEVEREPVRIDAELSLADVSHTTSDLIEQFAPFGLGNPKPLFLFKDVEVVAMKQFGKTKDHLELQLKDVNRRATAIAFFCEPERLTVTPVVGKKINMVASLEKSFFRGRPELRLRIIDSI